MRELVPSTLKRLVIGFHRPILGPALRPLAMGGTRYYRRRRNVTNATQEVFPRWVTRASD